MNKKSILYVKTWLLCRLNYIVLYTDHYLKSKYRAETTFSYVLFSNTMNVCQELKVSSFFIYRIIEKSLFTLSSTKFGNPSISKSRTLVIVHFREHFYLVVLVLANGITVHNCVLKSYNIFLSLASEIPTSGRGTFGMTSCTYIMI